MPHFNQENIIACVSPWLPIVASVRRPGRRGCVEEISGLQKLSRGFLRLVALPPTLPPPDSLYPGLPNRSLSSSTPYSFPYYKSVLPQRFRSTVWVAISLSPFPSGSVLYTVSSSVFTSIFSLCLSLYRPSLNKNPAFLSQRGPSGLPEP